MIPMRRNRVKRNKPGRTPRSPVTRKGREEPTGASPAFLTAIGLLSLAWRLTFLVRLHRTILFGDLSSDSMVFWTWSANLLRGQLGTSPPFFYGPLYAYWLALVRRPVPQSIEVVLLIQYLLGTVAILLITDVACRLTSRRAGATVGILLALN